MYATRAFHVVCIPFFLFFFFTITRTLSHIKFRNTIPFTWFILQYTKHIYIKLYWGYVNVIFLSRTKGLGMVISDTSKKHFWVFLECLVQYSSLVSSAEARFTRFAQKKACLRFWRASDARWGPCKTLFCTTLLMHIKKARNANNNLNDNTVASTFSRTNRLYTKKKMKWKRETAKNEPFYRLIHRHISTFRL